MALRILKPVSEKEIGTDHSFSSDSHESPVQSLSTPLPAQAPTLRAPDQHLFDLFLKQLAFQCKVTIRRFANLVYRLGLDVCAEMRSVNFSSIHIVRAILRYSARNQPIRLAHPVVMKARPAVVVWPVDHPSAHRIELNISIARQHVILRLR